MTPLQLIMFVLVAGGGTATLFTREPLRQALVFSLYGALMTILFVVIQAGDVALSQLAVGTVATPLMILVALVRVKKAQR